MRAVLGILLFALLGCRLLDFFVNLFIGASSLALGAVHVGCTRARTRRCMRSSIGCIMVCKQATHSGTSSVIRVSNATSSQ